MNSFQQLEKNTNLLHNLGLVALLIDFIDLVLLVPCQLTLNIGLKLFKATTQVLLI